MTDTIAPRNARDSNLVAQTSTLLPGMHTGVPGLDAVLGGTLPQYSFNIIAGSPGAGKTTLAQQIMFANATVERPALYFTVLGEPTLKMLRYQRRFSFFKPQMLGADVQFINLSAEVLSEDLNQVLDRSWKKKLHRRQQLEPKPGAQKLSAKVGRIGSPTLTFFFQKSG